MPANLLFILILQATPVGTVTLSEVSFTPQPDAPANVIARNESVISSEIRAVVTSLRVDVGDTPQAGDELVSLDCRSYRLAERSAQAQLSALRAKAELAETQVQRARKLRISETVSQELLDARLSELAVIEAEIRGAEAGSKLARLDVERCKVSAPYTGVVTQRVAQVGQLTQPGSPLLTLVETEGRRVAAQLSVRLIEQLDQATDLRFVSQDGETPLRLVHVVPVVDPRSRSQEVRLAPLGEGLDLPGTAGRLVWNARGVAVPSHFLLRRGGELGLFVLEKRGAQAIAAFHGVSGAVEGRPAIVELPPGTRLITDGRRGLEDGDLVDVR